MAERTSRRPSRFWHRTLEDTPEGELAELTTMPPEELGAEAMPRVQLTRRSVLLFLLFVVSALAFLYFVLPRLAGLENTWNRAREGDATWLVGALLCVCLAWLSYNTLFTTVYTRGTDRIGWRESFQITLAALAATRLFATAGAGGVALTAWALRRSGMPPRLVACRMVAFLALLYGVFMGALVVVGLGLYYGPVPGRAPFAVTVVPAIFGGTAIALVLSMAFLPRDFERRLTRWSSGRHRRLARLAQRLATVPASMASGVRTAIKLVRERHWGVLGAVGQWGFDAAVLYCAFRAFGAAPPIGVLIMGYFVGMLGNLLPLPGGIGGVDGGMIGAFLAFGVDGGLAVVAVLVYRGFAFWLPTVPGIVAYLKLRKTVKGWRREPAPAAGA